MSYVEPLSRHAVAISISESPDMNVFGLGTEHLVDAMAEVARHLLALGARLLYGGDLRPGGFTDVLFELVARYRRDAALGDERVGVTNFLAWPVHVSLTLNDRKELSNSLMGIAEVVYLTVGGLPINAEDCARIPTREPTHDEWLKGLTAMRGAMTRTSHARIILGGRTEHFKGRMPGVAEEALLAMESSQPLFLLGGFGGCARDIAEDFGLTSRKAKISRDWLGRQEFRRFVATDLNNGLDATENAVLANTPHVDEAVNLILRGLLRRNR